MKQKIEKTHAKEKQSHAQERGSAICLDSWSCGDFTIIRKKYKCGSTVFSLSQKLRQQTLITKVTFSTSCAQDSQWATKRAKKNFQASAPWTKPLKFSH